MKFLGEICVKCRKNVLSWAIMQQCQPRRLLGQQSNYACRSPGTLRSLSSFQNNIRQNISSIDPPGKYNPNFSTLQNRRYCSSASQPPKHEEIVNTSKSLPDEGGQQDTDTKQYTPDWTLRKVNIGCCQEMYIPSPEGIVMRVSYIDTAAELTDAKKMSLPTAVLTHGSPGSHEDMMGIAKLLVAEGFRVLLPNYPGYGFTKSPNRMANRMFGHTVEERVDFLGNFIHALNVEKVDLCFGHSASCFVLTALEVVYPKLNGFVYICPGTAPRAPKGLEPIWLCNLVVKMWENPLLWPVAWLLTRILAKRMTGGALPHKQPSYVLTSVQTMLGSRLESMPPLAQAIQDKKKPVLYVFCHRDPLLYEEHNIQYAAEFGVEQFDEYDKNGELVSKVSSPDNTHHGIKLLMKSHNPLRSSKHCEIIVQEALRLHRARQSSSQPQS